MRLLKKVLVMSMVTALTFTGIEMPVNATEYTNIQSEIVSETEIGVENEEVVTINDSTDTMTDTSQAETIQSTYASSEGTTSDEPAASDQIAAGLTTTLDLNAANLEQGSFSVADDATVVNESANSIEVSNEKSTVEEITTTGAAEEQPEVPSTQTTVDANETTIPANQTTVTPPEIPANVTATVNSYNNVKITWNSVAGAQGYIIERIQSGTESAYTELEMITTAEYTDTTIAVGKEYKYRVYAYLNNESNELLKSAASLEATAQTSIAEPQSLTGVQASETSIKLSWDTVEGAVQYKIYRAKKGQAYKLIKTQKGTSYTNSKLKTGTKYYYKVTAVNGDYESASSKAVSLYAAAKSVTKLKAKSSTYNKITLTWKKASGATKYVIYRSTSKTSGFKKIKTVTTTNYTNKVKTGVKYYYKVVSYSNKAKGGVSTIVSAASVCAAPTNVKVTSKSDTSAKITWKKTSGAGLYAIYRSTSKSSGYTLLCNVSKSKSSYTDKTVSAGTKYYYKICAVTRNVEGKTSKVVSVNIKPKAVKNLKVTPAGAKNVTLTWSASNGATKYYIYRSTSSNKGYKKIGQTTELSYTNTKLKNGKTYYYRVYARAGKINSSYTQVSYVNPSKVYVSSSTLALKPGETSKLTVSFKPSKVSNTSITWSSADTAIATVSSEGVVTALKTGVTTVTATSYNGVKATCEVSVNKETPAPIPETNIVVVLDPGHGGSDPGAVYGSLREKDLTLKTAQYTKAELEKYNGVIVKMTRTTDTYVGLEQRTIIAKDYGADLFVSLHYNAGGSSANGAEVLVSLNGNYNSSSTKLGSQILSNLIGLGLNNRGTKTRLSSDGVSDYYSVIRNSVKRGFPGIIVEGAFVSSAKDRTILSTEAGLKSIGEAIATAIAEGYGLSKK